MSKPGCLEGAGAGADPPPPQCPNRFEVMDELNRHYSDRIEKIERTGYTELLVCNLKKWIEALVTHDKVLIGTIDSLEAEALARSERIAVLCQDRLRVEQVCEKYKKELCEKTDKIKELNCRLKEQVEALSQKECLIQRLNQELARPRNCPDCLPDEDDCSKEGDAPSTAKCRVESSTLEPSCKDSRLASQPDPLRSAQQPLRSAQQPLHGALEQQNEDLKRRFAESQSEIEKLQKMLNHLKASGDSNMESLKRNLDSLKRESREMKEALSAEVAEKHDAAAALRREATRLEDLARRADAQAILKDDIIRELRKEVKLARAKESLVEMLGLNEGSRVQMKSKMDALAAELEERDAEVAALRGQVEAAGRRDLERRLGEVGLHLMDRERDMLILCNKVDYIKRYLERLHEDEDVSIKCGLKALLLELKEETEWRRKARRSVTWLADQPDSVIIINRSNSLPAEPSEHVRYSGRVNELELKLERAREEICCLRKRVDTRESELADLRKSTGPCHESNKVDKALAPDWMLSMKLEEFQRFVEESGKKLEESMDDIKHHTGNLLLKEEMEELKRFLSCEQEALCKASRQLDVLLCNMRNSSTDLGAPANFKLQCLEKKLKSALETFDKEASCGPSPRQSESNVPSQIENMKSKLRDSLQIVSDLKQDAPMQWSNSTDPLSLAGSAELVQGIQETIQIVQNQSKVQQSRLFALMDNQREETGSLCNKFSEVDCLLRSHSKSIGYVKDELKMSLCNIVQRAEKVRKQAENISQLECTIKDVSNWINCNVKNNAELVSKVKCLQKNLEQILLMKNVVEDSRRELQEKCDSAEPDLNDFEDKCLVAQELCDEVVGELGRAAGRVAQREAKLTQLSKEISCFAEMMCRIQDEIVHTAHSLSGNDGCGEETSAEAAAVCLQQATKQLLQALHSLNQKLVLHHREADGYDIKGIESRKTIAARLKELEEALHDLSYILGEIKASKYMKTMRAPSNESVCDEVQEESCLSLVHVPSSAEHRCQRGVDAGGHDDSPCPPNQMISPESLIQEMRTEICSLNETICFLEKQNNGHQSTIEHLKCQLARNKDEADKAIQGMVSNLQEKCQSMESIVVSKQGSESSSLLRKPWVSWMYRHKHNPNKVHEV